MCKPHKDLPRDEFVAEMAKVYDGDLNSANDALDELLKSMDVEFGAEGYDWCKSMAKEIAMEMGE